MRFPYQIPHNASANDFPPIERALEQPDGLLAVGGDLTSERLLSAYRRGIFPWYSDDQPILWWSPDPRMVLFPEHLQVSRSLRKNIRNGGLTLSFDRAFLAVMDACAHIPRADQDGTWITPAIRSAYNTLHEQGIAHSVEAWQDNHLVGGLYGVAMGKVFFGESMFSHRSNASKVAFACCVKQLQSWGFEMIDCQVHTPHLESLGAFAVPRRDFKKMLDLWCDCPSKTKTWQGDLVTADWFPLG